uniref:hypothetical protein n=1 Tax=uncultured Sphingomonas sp. TaxID=158754 RepID=UPI0035CA7182
MALRGNPVCDEQIARLCAMLADAKTFSQIAAALEIPRSAVSKRIERLRATSDPRLPANRPTSKHVPRIVPKDFGQHAELRTEVLIARYTVGRATIARWRKEVGKPGRTTYTVRDLPDDFAELAPTLTLDEARARFGVANELLRRWEARTGVKLRRVRAPLPAGRLKMDRDNRRDMSRAGLAADFLRRLGPVFRCKPDGTPSEKGTHWRRGRYVLSAAEVIDRAERNGWQPDAWRTVASPTTHEGARA